MIVNKTGADGLALGERIKVVMRTRALTVTQSLARSLCLEVRRTRSVDRGCSWKLSNNSGQIRSREMHGDTPPGTKLVHGKLKTTSSKEASGDEDEEEVLSLAETQLNEALERNARRTVAQARAVMHDIWGCRGGCCPQGPSKKGSRAGEGTSKGQCKNRNSHGRAPGHSSNASTSQAGMRPHKPMPPSTRPCLKCGSRDHESGKFPKNQEHRS